MTDSIRAISDTGYQYGQMLLDFPTSYDMAGTTAMTGIVDGREIHRFVKYASHPGGQRHTGQIRFINGAIVIESLTPSIDFDGLYRLTEPMIPSDKVAHEDLQRRFAVIKEFFGTKRPDLARKFWKLTRAHYQRGLRTNTADLLRPGILDDVKREFAEQTPHAVLVDVVVYDPKDRKSRRKATREIRENQRSRAHRFSTTHTVGFFFRKTYHVEGFFHYAFD